MKDIIVELIDEYVERHKETLALLSISGLYENLIESSEEIRKGKGISLTDTKKE